MRRRYFISVVLIFIAINDAVTGKQISEKDKRATMTSSLRLTSLRALMASQPKTLAAYIVPTADAHNSEYISPADARREWLTQFSGSAGTALVTATRALVWTDGIYTSEYISPADARREWLTQFSGSAGTALVTATHALVWTDGRYYTQFEQQADMKLWTLMKQSLPDTPTTEKWLTSNLAEGSVVGADPTTMGREQWTPLRDALSKANMQLIAVKQNLVDLARGQGNDPPPARAHNELIVLPVMYTGKTSAEKVSELRAQMAAKRAAALVVTALDEVAYTLNLRGSDIEYNPVFFAYLVIRADSVVLFWHDGVLSKEVQNHLSAEGLSNVTARPYSEVFSYLEEMARAFSQNGDGKHSIWLSHDASEAIHTAAAGGESVEKPLTLISEVSPVQLAKLVKNEVELMGFRACHVRDGVAVVRFLRWLHASVDAAVDVTEVDAADKLLEFRRDEEDFMGPSFATIAGAGPHGAIIHYEAGREGPRTSIRPCDMFLLDSGGQYRDGTTDITRTRHMSANPTPEQRDAYTRVLKGQGNVLDSFARRALWEVGLDYAHGTGHGVGHYLNVHEGPSGVSWRPYPNDPGLASGVILSNEPGYYKVGEYGIRHEDLVEIVNITKESAHPKAAGLRGDYDGRGVLGFHTLTLVPNQRACIDETLLNDFELNYTNAYHGRVLATIGPILQERRLVDDLRWLEEECKPIARA